MKFVYEWIRMKWLRVKGYLSGANARMIMANLTPHIEMLKRVIYSFKSEIHQDAGEIFDCS